MAGRRCRANAYLRTRAMPLRGVDSQIEVRTRLGDGPEALEAVDGAFDGPAGTSTSTAQLPSDGLRAAQPPFYAVPAIRLSARRHRTVGAAPYDVVRLCDKGADTTVTGQETLSRDRGNQPLWVWLMVLTACGGRCVYCDERPSQTLEHEAPLASETGRDIWWNLVPACDRCNGWKHKKSAATWAFDMKMHHATRRPASLATPFRFMSSKESRNAWRRARTGWSSTARRTREAGTRVQAWSDCLPSGDSHGGYR